MFPRNKPHTEAPFTVPFIPPDADVSRHVFLYITDYFFETAGYVYYKAGMLKFTLTQDKVMAVKETTTASFRGSVNFVIFPSNFNHSENCSIHSFETEARCAMFHKL